MEADHHQASRRFEQFDSGFQALFELLKLGVDVNLKALKCARCRVLARFTGLDRTSHDFGKLPCGSNRVPAFAPSNKRLCNRYSKPFFPCSRDHLCNVALFGAGQEIRRALPTRRSIRMSSGASWRKLNPRAGLSICGELTPRSSSNPSMAGTPRAASRPSVRRRRVLDGEARIGERRERCRHHGLRGRVESDQPAARRQRASECPPRPKVPST